MNRKASLIIGLLILVVLILGIRMLGGSSGTPSAGQAASSSAQSVAASRSASSVSTAVKIYLVATKDAAAAFTGASLSCGDRLVPTDINIVNSTNIIGDAYSVLLQQGSKLAAGAHLTNALSGSTLTIQAVLLDAGTLTLHLSGTLHLKSPCDEQRVQQQLIQLGLQFPGIRAVQIFLNGKPIESYHSGR